MGRWEPGTRERLQAAALELFTSRGFEQTTAAEIAQSVGLTERTFFRHFADKREVIFGGQDGFLQTFTDGMRDAPDDATPLEAVGAAIRAVSVIFTDEMRPYSRMRQAVINDNPALRERELHKRSGMAAILAEGLRGRGVDEPMAALAAEAGATVFSIAFSRWISDGETRPIDEIISEVFDELRQLAATTG